MQTEEPTMSPATASQVNTPHAVPAGARAPAGDIPTLDWEGHPVDCRHCEHQDLRAQPGGCEPGYSCMQDAYARRIDRFFRQHPERAGRHLRHPYFEVRAIAARHVDIFQLGALKDDPDETVRLQVALRLPQRLLTGMCGDPHREVRIRVAQRLDTAELSRLIHDADYEVRTVVARRLPVALLPLLAADRDEQVRRVVAERLDMPALWRMSADRSPAVRRIVAERAPEPLLQAFLTDLDWGVRWTVAARANAGPHTDWLQQLAEDTDTEVSAEASRRLAEHGDTTARLAPVTSLHQGADHGRYRP